MGKKEINANITVVLIGKYYQSLHSLNYSVKTLEAIIKALSEPIKSSLKRKDIREKYVSEGKNQTFKYF